MTDRRPLLSYLRVQRGWEREVLFILKRAAAQADADLRRLDKRSGPGAQLKRDQLQLVRRRLLKDQADMWRRIGMTVQAARVEAAAAAIETSFVYERPLLRAVKIPKADQDVLLRSQVAQAERNVANVVTRHTLSKIPLSERVYKTQALSNGWLDRAINDALAAGTSARGLAKNVMQFISPDTPGGASYAAMRLGRTELNNAFHATSVQHYNEVPWIEGVQWSLSGSHPRPDECNEYAESEHFRGGDAGVFKPGDVPSKPHPNCLCYISPVDLGEDEFVKNFGAGKYDDHLDEVMRKSGYTEDFIRASR